MEIKPYLTLLSSFVYQNDTKVNGKTLAGYIAECYDRDGIKIPNLQKLNRINGREFETIVSRLGFYSSLNYGSWCNYPSLFLSVALMNPSWILNPDHLLSYRPSDLKPIEYTKMIKSSDGKEVLHKGKVHHPLIALALDIEKQHTCFDGLIVKSSEGIAWTTHKVFTVSRSLTRNENRLRHDPIVTIDRYIPKQSVRMINKNARFLVKGSDLKRENHDPLLGFFLDSSLPGIIALEVSNYSFIVQLSIEYNPRVRSKITGSYNKVTNRFDDATLTARVYDRLKNSKHIYPIGKVRTKAGIIQYKIDGDLPSEDITVLLSRLGMLSQSKHWDSIKNIMPDSMMLYQQFWDRKGLDCIVRENTVCFPKPKPSVKKGLQQQVRK